ncbi:MAG: SpoIIE family protein phosphatase [Butyricicoccaceae bacterium]
MQRKTNTRSLRARALSRTLAVFAGACVLSGAKIFGTYTPFGVAFTAACCRSGGGIPAAAGAFLGYFLTHRGMDSIQYSTATFILLVAAQLFSGTRLMEKRWFLPLWAAGAQLIASVLFHLQEGFETSAAVLMLCEAALTFGGAYFYSFVIDDQPELPFARPAGAMLLLAGILLTIYPVTVADMIVPARVCALVAVMAVTYVGGFAAGSAQGAMMGILMDAAGGSMYFSGIYAFAALVSGFFNHSGRVVFACVYTLANATASLLGIGELNYLPGLYECFIASVLFVLVPDGAWRRIKTRLILNEPVPTDYTGQVRETAQGYAKNASDAFWEMHTSLVSGEDGVKEDSDLGAVFDRAADRVCRKCPGREACWERDRLATVHSLDTISGPLLRTGRVVPSDFPGHFATQCLHFPDFILAINESMGALTQRRHYKKKIDSSRQLLAEQYAGITGILRQVGEFMGAGPVVQPEREKQLRTYAEAFGRVSAAAAWEDRCGRLHLELAGEAVSRILKNKEAFVSGLNAALDIKMEAPEVRHDGGQTTLRMHQTEPLGAQVGVGTGTARGAEQSGDSTSWFVTEEGRVCAVLSDGMGSGRSAAAESQRAVRMAEKFLRAGIAADDVAKTIGPALKIRAHGDSFVTLDLLTVDLFTGEACSVKCGAASGFVRTKDSGGKLHVRRLLSSTLPAGLEESGELDVVRFRVAPGDTLVMISDGVESIKPDDWLEQTILRGERLLPRELAARLIVEASARGATDDLSAIVISVSAKEVAV